MSFLARCAIINAAAVARPSTSAATTRFQSTRRAYSSVHDNDPVILEREKSRNLSRQPYQTSAPMDHAPGWNEDLASTAEAHIKADKSTENPQELAAKTVKHIQEKHSADERYDATSSTNEREELAGPLKQATTKVKEVIEEVITVKKD